MRAMKVLIKQKSLLSHFPLGTVISDSPRSKPEINTNFPGLLRPEIDCLTCSASLLTDLPLLRYSLYRSLSMSNFFLISKSNITHSYEIFQKDSGHEIAVSI